MNSNSCAMRERDNIYIYIRKRTTDEGYKGVDLSQPLEDIYIVRLLELYR
jgi:hypothetical protein